MVGALFFYFFEAVQGFARAETSILLLVYFVAGLAGAPVWSALAVRMGKHGALILACVYFAATLLLAAFAGPVLVPLAVWIALDSPGGGSERLAAFNETFVMLALVCTAALWAAWRLREGPSAGQ